MNSVDMNRTEYTFRDSAGEGRTVVYQVFPGLQAAYISAMTQKLDLGWQRGEAVCIHHCRDGRMEMDGLREFLCLTPGDGAVIRADDRMANFHLPLRHYRGLLIRIDPSVSTSPLCAFLDSCGYSIRDLLNISGPGVLRPPHRTAQFLDSLYDLNPDELRIRMPELLYHLTKLKPEYSHQVSRSQTDLALVVSAYIAENLSKRMTVQQLTAVFGVSDTCLQKAFRSVYGMPVITFIRTQKMQSAAQMLSQKPCTIAEIAESFGYENESKFAAAFKKVMGLPPGAYRREHTMVNIL